MILLFMNLPKRKPPLLIIIVIVLGLLGVLAFNASNSQNTSQPGQSGSSSEPESQEDTGFGSDGANDSSRYIEYTPEGYEIHKGERRVLFFFANWCPTCKPADISFRNNAASIPEDVTVIRVNYNDSDTDADEKQLANKYAVTYQHTFVQIDEDGTEITKWNGGQIEELLENIK